MKIIVNDHVYDMPKEQADGVLKIAKANLSCGIFAIKKDDIIELKNDVIENKDELMKTVADYARNGFKVYWNNNMDNKHN